MITEITMGDEGIVDYLINGQKNGRYFSRDELDERVPLHGDLKLIDDIINSIDRDNDKYFHITFSFKEHSVDSQIMSDIVEDFSKYFLRSFADNEVSWYAEAHNPRIKSYVDAKGNTIERKPHIHMVIPKVNLKDGSKLDVFVENYIPYNDAWQENINAEYGFESPKDNLRYKIHDNGEFISRYKGDGFIAKNKDFKVSLLNEIINADINSLDSLKEYLISQQHQIKIRNSNKELSKQYINIVNPDGNINLRDNVFREHFLKLPKSEKLKYLNDANNVSSKTLLLPTDKKSISDDNQRVMDEWKNYQAFEARYVINLSKKQRNKFYDLDEHSKQTVVNEYIHRVNNQIQIKESDDNGQFNEREYKRVIDKLMESTRTHIESLNNTLSGRCGTEGVYATERWRSELKRRYSTNYKQSIGSERRHGDHQNSSNYGKLNPDSSVIENIEYTNFNLNGNSLKEVSNKLNTKVQANVLLEILEKTHGLNPELYRITVARDGSDRIGVGNRNMSNIDFCLREMHLPLKESISILEIAYQAQQEINRKQSFINADGKYLFNEYSSWIESYKKERVNLLATNKTNQRKIKDEVKQKYADKISVIRADKSIPFHKKREIIQATRFEQMTELQSVNKMIYQLNIDTRKKYNLEMQQAYRVFLMRKAMKENDERALQELRRLRINYTAYTETLTFNYTTRYNEFRIPLSHEIDKDGVVHYKVNDATVIKDHGVRVEVVKTKDDYLEMSFKLAQQKFGNKISLRGKEQFRKNCVEFAIKKGYKVEFVDDFSREYHQKLLQNLQNKSNLWDINSKNIIRDAPDKLIVKQINQEQSLLNGKSQTINELILINPDTNSEYKLANSKLHFIAQKINIGDFVDVYLDKNTNEVLIKLANESKIRYKIKQDIIEDRRSDFKHHVSTLYPDSNSEYYGKIVKSRINQSKPWVLLKTDSGKFVKFNNPDVILQLKSCKIGDYASVINVGTKDIEISKQSTKTTIQPYPTISHLTAKYKSTKDTIIGEILKQTEFKHHDNQIAYRILVNNLTTGKKEIVFSNHIIDVQNGEYVALDKVSWNNFKVKRLDTLSQEINQYKNDKSITVGIILSSGETNIRGKNIFHIEVQTINGIVKKYGENLKSEMAIARLKTGDNVRIERYDIQISETTKQNLFESKNLSQDLDNEIINRKIQYSINI